MCFKVIEKGYAPVLELATGPLPGSIGPGQESLPTKLQERKSND